MLKGLLEKLKLPTGMLSKGKNNGDVVAGSNESNNNAAADVTTTEQPKPIKKKSSKLILVAVPVVLVFVLSFVGVSYYYSTKPKKVNTLQIKSMQGFVEAPIPPSAPSTVNNFASNNVVAPQQPATAQSGGVPNATSQQSASTGTTQDNLAALPENTSNKQQNNNFAMKSERTDVKDGKDSKKGKTAQLDDVKDKHKKEQQADKKIDKIEISSSEIRKDPFKDLYAEDYKRRLEEERKSKTTEGKDGKKTPNIPVPLPPLGGALGMPQEQPLPALPPLDAIICDHKECVAVFGENTYRKNDVLYGRKIDAIYSDRVEFSKVPPPKNMIDVLKQEQPKTITEVVPTKESKNKRKEAIKKKSGSKTQKSNIKDKEDKFKEIEKKKDYEEI